MLSEFWNHLKKSRGFDSSGTLSSLTADMSNICFRIVFSLGSLGILEDSLTIEKFPCVWTIGSWLLYIGYAFLGGLCWSTAAFQEESSLHFLNFLGFFLKLTLRYIHIDRYASCASVSQKLAGGATRDIWQATSQVQLSHVLQLLTSSWTNNGIPTFSVLTKVKQESRAHNNSESLKPDSQSASYPASPTADWVPAPVGQTPCHDSPPHTFVTLSLVPIFAPDKNPSLLYSSSSPLP